MANEEVLGPRKTMFVLVIVVGCFAVLWPRILSPLIVGHTRDKLQPNQFDREAGCCEVMFEKELAVLELINEVCSSAVHVDGKLSAYGAAECRKAVNETCGLDIAAFLKRSDNIGKTSKKLVDMMKSTNSSCLKEHFGVPVVSLGPHLAFNSWTFQDTMKQERTPIRGAGPHPALRERGRAIPPGTPPTPARSNHIQLPPNARVGNSPLAVYFDLDIKPPPIPGMRPPLGSPGGPVPAPKSSMGFVMPIYTICIIVFFVYTISKIFFTRATASPYESVAPDPQFRRRVFRDDSRTTPDKLVVTAISGLVAEVRQQMEAGYEQNQQRQDAQDNQTRPYTNGNVIHNSGPVHIIASEYHEKEKSPELNGKCPEQKEHSPKPKEASPEPKESSPERKESSPEPKESSPALKDQSPEPESKNALEQPANDATENKNEESKEIVEDSQDTKEIEDSEKDKDTVKEHETADKEEEIIPEELTENHKETVHIDLTKPIEIKRNGDVMHKITVDFIKEEVKAEIEDEKTKELLEEAIDEESEEKDDVEQENASVKVMGMELIAHSADGGTFPAASAPAVPPATAPPARTHEAKDVKSIFLETEIPQQSRVLIADFGEDRPKDRAPKHSPMVVSGKMTLSLIQDAPRDTPERDAESTFDDFTTASAVTQNAAEKEGEESDEDLEEEIEIEEIEEEIEVEEEEEEEDDAKKGTE